MGRRYRVSFENIAVSAAQDIFQASGATGKILAIRRVSIGASNATPTAQQLYVRARYLPATVSNIGTSATVVKTDPGDANATFTADTNKTSKATTSGTAAILGEWGFYLNASFDEEFARPPIIGPTAAFVFELLSTPSGTLNMSGLMEVEEIG